MNRSDYVGGTDAKRIVDGDWLPLYEEKVGIREPENLTHSFRVQLGIYTEAFHIRWLNMYHGFSIGKPKSFVRPLRTWQVAHVDGVCALRGTFVDTKHSNGQATKQSMIDWYLPQMAHYCMVTGYDHGWLSFIAGNAEPEFFKVEPSLVYMTMLDEVEQAFWWHVETKTPPDALPTKKLEAVAAAAAEVLIDDMRAVDMKGNNGWARAAGDYLDHADGAKRFEQAKKDLKELVEADVRHAWGYGVQVKRSKSGSLLISETKS